MKFFLFSVIPFEVPDPNTLIESYCIQSNFYSTFDVVPFEKRTISHVNKIGARIKRQHLQKCSDVLAQHANTKSQSIFSYNLDSFVNLDSEERRRHIEEFSQGIVKKLLKIDGIGLSKATKILHALFPEIIPMIDNPLQDLYRRKANNIWSRGEPQIFIDYYKSLERETTNWKNITKVYRDIKKKGLRLTKVRVFDILWWSFLRAKQLNEEHEEIQLSSIRW